MAQPAAELFWSTSSGFQEKGTTSMPGDVERLSFRFKKEQCDGRTT